MAMPGLSYGPFGLGGNNCPSRAPAYPIAPDKEMRLDFQGWTCGKQKGHKVDNCPAGFRPCTFPQVDQLCHFIKNELTGWPSWPPVSTDI